jgi:hypothetical protein
MERGSLLADKYFDPNYNHPTIEEQHRRRVRAFQNIRRRLDSLIAYEMGREHGPLDIVDRLDAVGVMPQDGDEIVVLYKTIEKWQGKAVADAIKRASTKTYTGRFKTFTSWLLYHSNIATYADATLYNDRAHIVVKKFVVYEILPNVVRSIQRKKMKKRKRKAKQEANKKRKSPQIALFIDELNKRTLLGPEIARFVFKVMQASVNVDILDSQLRLNGFVFIAEILKKARELEVAGMAKKTAAITAWQETLR